MKESEKKLVTEIAQVANKLTKEDKANLLRFGRDLQIIREAKNDKC